MSRSIYTCHSNYEAIKKIIFVSIIFFNLLYPKYIYRVKHYDVFNGLPDNRVVCITQDYHGFIFIDTPSGISRFDGYQFYEYNIKGLPVATNRLVSNIFPINREKLLVGTFGRGLYVFNYRKEELEELKIFVRDSVNVDTKSLNVTSISKYSDNSLIISTLQNGIYLFNHINNSFEKLNFNKTKEFDFSKILINCVKTDRNGNLYIGTLNNGLIIYSKDTKEIEKYESEIFCKIFDIYVDENDSIWLATDSGLVKFNPKFSRFTYYPLIYRDKKFKDCLIYSIDKQGDSLYLAVQSLGVFIFNIRSKSFESVFDQVDFGGEKRPNSINEIYIDSWGNIWLGTYDEGLWVLSKKLKFKNFNIASILKSEKVRRINSIIYQKGVCWIATQIGLIKLDTHRKRVDYIELPDCPEDSVKAVYTLYLDKESLLIGRYSCLQILDLRDMSIENIDIPSRYFRNGKIGVIWDINKDKKGNYWLATLGTGIIKLDTNLEFVRAYSLGEYGIDNYITSIEIDEDGTIWAGTNISGIINLTETGDIIKEYNLNSKPHLTDEYITSMLIDDDGDIIIGTYLGGLNIIKKDGSILYFNKRNGLASNFVVGITQDGMGNIWISTDRGISRLNIKDEYIVNFDINDGVEFYLKRDKYPANLYGSGITFALDGSVWVGGINTVTYFNPADISSSLSSYEVKISSISITDRDGKQRNIPFINDTLELSYKDKFIRINISALDYYDPLKCQYRYTFKGMRSDWINVGNTGTLTFSNLRPGKHRLFIEYLDYRGIKTDKIKEILVKVSPPFYSTWGFRTMATIGLILLVIIAIQLRVASIRAQNIKLENLVKIRTEELCKKQDELLKAYGELEDKVKERTKELQELNKQLLKEIEIRKFIEDVLRENDNLIRSLLDAALDSVIMVDKEGKIIALNQTAANMFGLQRSYLISANIYKFNFFNITKSTIDEIITNKTPKVCHIEFDNKFYERYFYPIYSLQGDVDKVAIFIRDITDLKKAEIILLRHKEELEEQVKKRTEELAKINEELNREINRRAKFEKELRESEERFRYLFENADDLIWLVDVGGKFRIVNRLFLNVLGYKRHELIGKKNNHFIEESYRQLYQSYFKETVKGQARECEIKVLSKRKEEIILWIKMVPIRDQERVVGVFFIGRDITQLKKNEEELMKAEARKRESLREFTLKLAHEMKNPLASIRSSAQILSRMNNEMQNERYNRHINVITRNVDICNKIIKDLYNYTSEVKADLRRLDVKKIAERLSAEIEKYQEEFPEIKFSVNLKADDVKIVGDEEKLLQAFQNVITNAIESISGRGKVDIVISSSGDKYRDEYVEFIFTDSGSGIDKKDVDKVFNPFYSSKATGFGLGLSIVKEIIELHKGIINLVSEKGKGTVVTILIPIYKG